MKLLIPLQEEFFQKSFSPLLSEMEGGGRKLCVRPHLDCGEIIYNQRHNFTFIKNYSQFSNSNTSTKLDFQ